MGLFTSKKILVSSSAYNMAGDITERPNFLKTLVTGNVISNSKNSISDTIVSGYMKGPGLRLRSFMRWAVDNYNYIGIPQGPVIGVGNVNNGIIAAALPISGTYVFPEIQDLRFGIADVQWWVEQYILANRPADMNTAYTIDVDNITGSVTITFVDTSTYTFTPADYDPDAMYIYVSYISMTMIEEMLSDIGPTTTLPAGEDFDTINWSPLSDSRTSTAVTLTSSTSYSVSYSDGRTPETIPTTYDSWTDYYRHGEAVWRYVATSYVYTDPIDSARKVIFVVYERYDTQTGGFVISETVTETTSTIIAGGVTRTVTATTNPVKPPFPSKVSCSGGK